MNEERPSTTKRRAMRKEQRTRQNYEARPPRCLNCKHFEPPKEAVPGKHAFQQAMCGLGHFPVNSYAICDYWRGKDGATLKDD